MTLDKLLAIEEIRDLRHSYAAHLDSKNLDALLELFTEDAQCEFGGYGIWRGREQIRANYASVMEALGEQFTALHVVTNPWIRIDSATQARGRWYLLDLLTQQNPAGGYETRGGHDQPLLYLGMYEDDYAKPAGRWLIRHVKLHFLWPQRGFTELRHPRMV
jgi:hypothetical protein